ncbi:ribosome maturation factor RimP [Saccharothrix coeruleofusca]|uniref:Ribosome maturation factor RimP n=1 Tax=Saccharothrix coeruleofusca TaxID=33919 RepID=A0A918AMY4_9PSEU|nr:ribosome maturation factor RimP [Saccharothrix coeruleofusca]MBP2338431.1 ribosome maturation factor RimP [Saccharothrix coeruleofusca]GGP48367.1 ribosome maturation factor RimP [Saccharothrix coeruleofusca]
MSSPPRGELAAQLAPVVREAVEAIGFDLELLDVNQAGRRRLVKVVVDGEDGIGLDEVAQASRAISAALDAHEHLIAGSYTLEVTSPGADRPLTRPRHWRRARLRLVKVKQPDRVEWFGRVGDADDTGVVLLVKGELRRVEYRDIERAVVEVEFKQPPAEELALLGGRGSEEESE